MSTTERKLCLVTITENPDGGAEFDFAPSPRCERCAHWDGPGFGNFGGCAMIIQNTDREHVPSAPSCSWCDDARQKLRTPASFGCVLFEEKPPKLAVFVADPFVPVPVKP